MTMEDDPSLEDALDGLMDAAQYADDRIDDYDPDDEGEIEQSLCYRISELYQEVALEAPASDWDAPEKNVVREIEIDEIE